MFDPEIRPRGWYRGKRVTVMGLGLFGGGRGAVEFLCARGADVTVTDLRSVEKLAPTIAEIAHLPVRQVLGVHRDEDFFRADLVVVNPAVPRTVPLLAACRERGVPLDTEMNLFFKECRARICAITGSNGKTTTTRLIAAMAGSAWPGTRVGGNVGHSLLPEVDAISDDEWVVLELSSFQLEDLAALPRRPEVALVTNLAPNHLDRHGTFERYIEAKREILAPSRGGERGVAVLCADDALLRDWARTCDRDVALYGLADIAQPTETGAWYRRTDEGGAVVWRDENGAERRLFERGDLQLRGDFNAVNAAGAAAASIAMGVPDRAIADSVRAFRPVAHRLELVACDEGVEFFNDSIATTPESAIAALEVLGPRVWLICGGSSKGCSFDALAAVAAKLAKGILLIGATADAMERSLAEHGASDRTLRCDTLDRAIDAARMAAEPGDRIVLSPACPSYDQFTNFVERGDRFRAIVRSLARAPTC